MQLGAMNLLQPPRPVRFTLFAAACAAVLWVTLIPADEVPQTGIWDKFEHFIAYAVLALLGAWALQKGLVRLAIGLILMGVGVEVLQTLMHVGRQGDIRDALANSLGVATGIGLARIAGGRR